MNVLQLIMQARQDNGITVSYNGVGFTREAFTSGYMVSAPHGIENLPNRALIPAVLEAFVDDNEIAWDIAYFGLWQDERGNWSVDFSFHVEDRDAAIRTGVTFDQRAIWDNARGVAITL